MITIDFHAYDSTASVQSYGDFCSLRMSEGSEQITVFLELQDIEKVRQIATLMNEVFDSRRAYAANGFLRPAKIEPAALEAAE